MRAKTIILLWSIAISLGVSACASPPAQQVVEPAATNSPTVVELPSSTKVIPTPLTQAPIADSTMSAPQPTTILATVSTTPPANGTVSALGDDPHLEPGFPIEVGASPYHLPMAVGNIDSSPAEEIVVIRGQRGARQLLALNADGSPVDGWPVDGRPAGMSFHSNFALGEFSNASPGLEVVSYLVRLDPVGNIMEWGITTLTGSGDTLPGWPITYQVIGSRPDLTNPLLVVDLSNVA